MRYISTSLHESLRKGHTQVHDILVVVRGNGVGKIGLISKDYSECNMNAQLAYLRTDGETIDSEFLYYLLSSVEYQDKLKSYASGSAQPQLPLKALRMIEIKYPKIEEQKLIAHILSTLDEKIDVNNQINITLEAMAQALFKQWFIDFEFPNENGEPYKSSGGEMVESELGLIPKGWGVSTLDMIMEITSGKRPDNRHEAKTNEAQFPLVGATSIMGYTTSFNFCEPILIIGRVGTHGVIQRFSSKVWASDNTLVIRSKFYEFVNQILNQVDYRSLNRGSTQPLITQTDMKNHQICLPKVDILQTYEIVAKAIFTKHESNKIENFKLEEIRDTLLAKLMSGEIRVPMDVFCADS